MSYFSTERNWNVLTSEVVRKHSSLRILYETHPSGRNSFGTGPPSSMVINLPVKNHQKTSALPGKKTRVSSVSLPLGLMSHFPAEKKWNVPTSSVWKYSSLCVQMMTSMPGGSDLIPF